MIIINVLAIYLILFSIWYVIIGAPYLYFVSQNINEVRAKRLDNNMKNGIKKRVYFMSLSIILLLFLPAVGISSFIYIFVTKDNSPNGLLEAVNRSFYNGEITESKRFKSYSIRGEKKV